METTTITPAPEQITPIKLDINGYKAEITPYLDTKLVRIEADFEIAAVLPKIAECYGVHLFKYAEHPTRYECYCRITAIIPMQAAMHSIQSALSEHIGSLCNSIEAQTPIGTSCEYGTNSPFTAIVRDNYGAHVIGEVKRVSLNEHINTVTVYSDALANGYNNYGTCAMPNKSITAVFEELKEKFIDYVRKNNGLNGCFDFSEFLSYK